MESERSVSCFFLIIAAPDIMIFRARIRDREEGGPGR